MSDHQSAIVLARQLQINFRGLSEVTPETAVAFAPESDGVPTLPMQPIRQSGALPKEDTPSASTGLPGPRKPEKPPVLKGSIDLELPDDPRLPFVGGEAVFWIEIDDIGRVVRIAIQQSGLPETIQSAAERALLKARFIPAMRDGYYVPSQMRWQVTIAPELGMELQTLGKPIISTTPE